MHRSPRLVGELELEIFMYFDVFQLILTDLFLAERFLDPENSELDAAHVLNDVIVLASERLIVGC